MSLWRWSGDRGAGASDLALDAQPLHFIKEFGLILFVYTIGIQVGLGFFSSLRSSGLKLDAFAAMLVILGCVVAAGLHQLCDVPLSVILGVFSGAVTNTPSLGAGQQILAELGAASGSTGLMGMGYAVAYPFGICGILLTMWLVRVFFRIKIDDEAAQFELQTGKTNKYSLQTINIAVRNPNMHGLMLSEIPSLDESDVICSRLKRADEPMVPRPDSRIELGDLLHFVGEHHALYKVLLVLGEEVKT